MDTRHVQPFFQVPVILTSYKISTWIRTVVPARLSVNMHDFCKGWKFSWKFGKYSPVKITGVSHLLHIYHKGCSLLQNGCRRFQHNTENLLSIIYAVQPVKKFFSSPERTVRFASFEQFFFLFLNKASNILIASHFCEPKNENYRKSYSAGFLISQEWQQKRDSENFIILITEIQGLTNPFADAI